MVAAFMMELEAASNRARSVGTDFFQQVTEHQHADEGYCRGDEQGLLLS